MLTKYIVDARQRNFTYLPILSFACTVIITWEATFLYVFNPKNSPNAANTSIAHWDFVFQSKTRAINRIEEKLKSKSVVDLQVQSMPSYLLGRVCSAFSRQLEKWPPCTPLYCNPNKKRSLHFSSAPTSGGQYYWVAMLAPKSYRRFLSYITGILFRRNPLRNICTKLTRYRTQVGLP
jgi:hypothetical protein